MILVMGPRSPNIVGYTSTKEEALQIVLELNGMIDDMEDQHAQVDQGLFYWVKEVKLASEHLAACREMGFPF